MIYSGPDPVQRFDYGRSVQFRFTGLGAAGLQLGEQSANGTNSAHTIASARTTTAIHTGHWMPRGRVAQRFEIGKR
jgi:hypothetical protein